MSINPSRRPVTSTELDQLLVEQGLPGLGNCGYNTFSLLRYPEGVLSHARDLIGVVDVYSNEPMLYNNPMRAAACIIQHETGLVFDLQIKDVPLGNLDFLRITNRLRDLFETHKIPYTDNRNVETLRRYWQDFKTETQTLERQLSR